MREKTGFRAGREAEKVHVAMENVLIWEYNVHFSKNWGADFKFSDNLKILQINNG